jgi:LuxR family maltose regulon positive regulatory protein
MRQVPAAAFRPPALPVDCVGRPDLERRLGAPRAAGVSLVTGPPGYGKTTTVRQWLETLDSPWAWINLDPVISRPDLFWRGVVRAVQTAAPDRTLDAIDAVSVDAVDPSDVVRTLVEDLDANRSPTRPIVLVIDDAHLLEPGVWRDLEWLIAHQPPLLHLVLCSRADPRSRWRGCGRSVGCRRCATATWACR